MKNIKNKSRNGMCAVIGELLLPSPYTNTHTKKGSVSTSAFRLRSGDILSSGRNILSISEVKG